MKNKIPLTFESLYVGMQVLVLDLDKNFSEGIIKDCDNVHNVFVESNGITSIYCMVKYCPYYDPLFPSEK